MSNKRQEVKILTNVVPKTEAQLYPFASLAPYLLHLCNLYTHTLKCAQTLWDTLRCLGKTKTQRRGVWKRSTYNSINSWCNIEAITFNNQLRIQFIDEIGKWWFSIVDYNALHCNSTSHLFWDHPCAHLTHTLQLEFEV